MEYRVTWDIDIDADSPLEAAREARRIQLNPDSSAVFFRVVEGLDPDSDRFHDVDLLEYPEE